MHGSTLTRTTESNTRAVDIIIVEFTTMFSRDCLWLCELTSIGIAAQRDLDLRAVCARHLLRAVQSQFCWLRNMVRVGVDGGQHRMRVSISTGTNANRQEDGHVFHGVKENEDGVLSRSKGAADSIRLFASIDESTRHNITFFLHKYLPDQLCRVLLHE